MAMTMSSTPKDPFRIQMRTKDMHSVYVRQRLMVRLTESEKPRWRGMVTVLRW